MQPEEYATLTTDIREHGQQEPIWLYEGKILEGWHRFKACLELGLTPRTQEFNGTAQEAKDYVISRNSIRRHLNQSQQACVAVDYSELNPELTEEAKKRMAAG